MMIESNDLVTKKILVGTRGSLLALRQTELVVNELKAAFPYKEFEIVTLSTKGDRQIDKPLMEFGGKAVFVEEFEQALINGTIDMAIHSAKDMPMELSEGLITAGVLKRATPTDVLIYRKDVKAEDIRTVGTSSLRRACQITKILPGVECVSLRGNINTRLNKLKDGLYDAIILAAAGIERLGLDKEEDLGYMPLDITRMLPAACQGIIAIETKATGEAARMAEAINDDNTYLQFATERRVLLKIGAGCHEPVGVFSSLNEDEISIELMKAQSGSLAVVRKQVKGRLSDIDRLVEELAETVI